MKKGWYVKKRKYRKRCYLIRDFWNNLLAEIKNAASWCIDASMYLCLHLLQIINKNDTEKIQSKNIYIKRANCAYIGQTRWICWHRNRWCFTNSIATCNDNEKKSLKAIQSKDITHIKNREITTSNHTVKASRSLLFGDQMIHLPSSDDGEKVLIYILFYMMKTNSIIEFFYNNILSVRELIGVRIQGSTTYRA